MLAQKYRPRTLDDLVGQDAIQSVLKHALDNKKFSQSYVFTGTRGVGKTSLLRILARSLNCEMGPTSTPCGKCNNCLEMDKESHVDLIEQDAATSSSVEDVRIILNQSQYLPSIGKYRIVGIDEAHSLSDKAWEAFLKSIEEPPPWQIYVFATTEIKKIPSTILSRCQSFALKKIMPKVLKERLAYIASQEDIEIEGQSLDIIARFGDGSLRDSITLFEQCVINKKITEDSVFKILGIPTYLMSIEIFKAITQKDVQTLYSLIKSAENSGIEPFILIKEIAILAYTAWVGKMSEKNIISAKQGIEVTKELLLISRSLNLEVLSFISNELTKISKDVQDGVFPQITLEMSLIGLISK